MTITRQKGHLIAQLPSHPNNLLCLNIFPLLLYQSESILPGEHITVRCWTPSGTLEAKGQILDAWSFPNIQSVPSGLLRLATGHLDPEQAIRDIKKYYASTRDLNREPTRIFQIARHTFTQRHQL